MKVLVTGNLGYVGSCLGKFLKERYQNIELTGLDAGFFSHALTTVNEPVDRFYQTQLFADVRDFDFKLLKNFDAIVHLAAISNDPMGNQFASVTAEINREAIVKISKEAMTYGVKNIVFASSCSMYGSASEFPKKESDVVNPLTEYAKSKIGVETDLLDYDFKNSVFTSLRFSTACGLSPRTRLDLVLNDFVFSALRYKKISILSDGTPWRPLVHVNDMCRAIDWAIRRNDENNDIRSINIGSNEWNYQIKDLANAVANNIGNVDVNINLSAPEDKRSYKVDFSLFKRIAPNYQPEMDLDRTISELAIGLNGLKLDTEDFRSSRFIRLNMLRDLMNQGQLNNQLRYL